MDGKLALGNAPLLLDDIPDGDIAAHQRELNLLALAGLKLDLVEAAQLLDRGTLASGGRELDVELGHGGAGDVASVADGSLDGVDGLPQGRVTARGDGGRGSRSAGNRGVRGRGDGERFEAESGVGKTEAEFVQHADVVVIEVAVVNEQTLGEVGLPSVGVVLVGDREGDVGEVVVRLLERNGVGELARGVDVAVKDVNNAVANLLTGQVGSDDSGDVLVVGPGHQRQASRGGDDDSVAAVGGDLVNDLITIPVDVQVGAVLTLGSPGLEEDKADVRDGVDLAGEGAGSRQQSVVQDVLDNAILRLDTVLDSLERADDGVEADAAGTTTGGETAIFVVGALGVKAVGDFAGSIAEDSDDLGALERKSAVDILQKDGTSSTKLTDVHAVVATDINRGLGVESTGGAPVIVPVALRLEVVNGGVGARGGVDTGETLVLAEKVVRGEDTLDHVVDTSLRNGAVLDSLGEVATEVGRNAVEERLPVPGTGHGHVKTRLNRGNTTVGAHPVGHDVALEAELGLQDAVQGLGVLAGVGAVDALVAAHDTGDTSANGVGEGPDVELVDGTVFDVGRDGHLLLFVGLVVGIEGVLRVALSLLLVHDPVLGRSLNTDALNTKNGLLHGNTSEVWVRREALPATTGHAATAKRTSDGAKENLRALSTELLAEEPTTLVDEVPVPGSGGSQTSAKGASIISLADGERAILKTEALEADAGNGCDVSGQMLANRKEKNRKVNIPNAGTRSTGKQDDLLLEGQVAEEGLSLLQGTRPAGQRGGVDAGHVGRGVDRRTGGEERGVPVLGSLSASHGAEEEGGQVRERRHCCLKRVVVEACLGGSSGARAGGLFKGRQRAGVSTDRELRGKRRWCHDTACLLFSIGAIVTTSSGFWKRCNTGMLAEPGVVLGAEELVRVRLRRARLGVEPRVPRIYRAHGMPSRWW